jgi:hypothetical protein
VKDSGAMKIRFDPAQLQTHSKAIPERRPGLRGSHYDQRKSEKECKYECPEIHLRCIRQGKIIMRQFTNAKH